VRLGMKFGYWSNPGPQHGHSVMRREEFSRQADISQVAADWRRAPVTLKAMPAQRVNRPLTRLNLPVCQLLNPQISFFTPAKAGVNHVHPLDAAGRHRHQPSLVRRMTAN
jgi:hypothetical protein